MGRILRLMERVPATAYVADLAGGKATDRHMTLINALPGVLKPLAADDVIVRGVALVNDRPFKDGCRVFRASALDQIAGKLRGVPVMLNHDTFSRDALPVGRTFAAELWTDGEGTKWARALFYMLANDDGQKLAEEIDGGQVSEASVGIGFETLECSICGAEAGDCKHRPGEMVNGSRALLEIADIVDVFEWSLVFQGMVDGTHYFLAAKREAEGEDVDAMLSRKAARSPIEQWMDEPAVDPWAEWVGERAAR